MASLIRTYSMRERAAHPDFAIHDETRVTRIPEAHRHEYFQIQLSLAGHTDHHIGSVARPLERGSLSFVLPYRIHRTRRPPGSRFIIVNFTQRFLRPELEVDPLDLEDIRLEQAPELAPFLYQEFMDFRLDGADFRLAREACRKMIEESRDRKLCSSEIIRAQLVMLLAVVCRRYETEIYRLAAKHAARQGRRAALTRVVRYIRDNLTGRLSLADAAAAANLSPNYLAHLVKKETGRSFTDLVYERRMEKAQELLVHTTMRISEVAEAVGFQDEAYFARRFSRRFKMPPTSYRRKAASAAFE